MTIRRAIAGAPSGFEYGLLVLTFFALAGALSAFLPHGQSDALVEMEKISEGGDSNKQLILSLFYVINLVFLVRIVRPWAWNFIGIPLLGLTVLCFASIAWSVIPDGTARRAVAVTGPVVVGLYVGLRFDERRLTGAICTAAGLALIGSAIWAAFFRSLAFDENGYFRGLFYHKDAFGAFLGLSILTAVYRLLVVQHRKTRSRLLLASLIGCSVLAGSSTTVVTILAALFALALAMLLRRSEGLLLSIGPIFICFAAFAVLMAASDLGTVTDLLGRSSSLSGRIPIWQFVIPKIGERPWLGYGYGVFWLGERAPGASFEYLSGEHVAHTHNGYLQLLLDAGVVGLVFFAASLIALALVLSI